MKVSIADQAKNVNRRPCCWKPLRASSRRASRVDHANQHARVGLRCRSISTRVAVSSSRRARQRARVGSAARAGHLDRARLSQARFMPTTHIIWPWQRNCYLDRAGVILRAPSLHCRFVDAPRRIEFRTALWAAPRMPTTASSEACLERGSRSTSEIDQRRRRDSNPWYLSVRRFSKPLPSTTRPLLQVLVRAGKSLP